MIGAEAVDEEIFEIAERNSAVDRPPRGERHDERVSTAGGSFGAGGRMLDGGKTIFETGDSLLLHRVGRRGRGRCRRRR